MRDEKGFTLTEMVAALFVLSLGMVSLGSVTNLLMRGWDHIQTSESSVLSKIEIREELHLGEDKLKSDLAFYEQPRLVIDDGPDLILALPKLDRPADCDFDLVGRRCRL